MIPDRLKTMVALLMLGTAATGHASDDNKHRKMMTHSTVEVCTGESPCTESKIPPESYTRLVIKNRLVPAPRGLSNDERTWFRRVTSSLDIILEASLATDTGRFKDVTPLLYRRYESSRKSGENWTRELTFDEQEYPLFLVTGDPASQIARFTFDARFDRKPSTDAAQLSLGFLSAALKAVSPGSAVVTSLTSESADKVAAKVDESVGKFFAQSVSEKSRFDIDLYNFKPRVITVYGSDQEEDSLNPDLILGQWLITFAPARPSIFSSVECVPGENTGDCDASRKSAAFTDAVARPNTVLAFALIDKVGSSGTVLSYLKQQEWWASDLAELPTNNKHAAFCRKIRGTMGEIGLSDIDGRIIANAVAQSGVVSDGIKTKMLAAPDCKNG